MYLQVSVDFPAMFLLLISGLIPLWSESRHCRISILLHVSQWVLWPRLCSILVSIPWELEKNVYWAIVAKVVNRYRLDPVDWWYWVQLCPHWFFCVLVCPFPIDVEVSNCNSEFMYFFLQFHQFLPHVLWNSVVGEYLLRIIISSWRTDPLSLCNYLLYLGYPSLLWSPVWN